MRSSAAQDKRENKDAADTGSVEDVGQHVCREFGLITQLLEEREAGWYKDDRNLRSSLVELLQLKTMGEHTLGQFLKSKQQVASAVCSRSLRSSGRKYYRGLEKQLQSETDADARCAIARVLCKCEGLQLAEPTGSSSPDLVRDEANELGETPLIEAAATGNARHVRLLLQAHACIEDRDKLGGTALMAASEYGHVECLLLLVEEKAELNGRRTAGQASALILAAREGNADCVETLLQSGSQSDAQMGKAHDGHSALTISALNGHTRCVELLLQNDPSLVNVSGAKLPALCWSIRNRHVETIRVLASAKADVNVALTETGYKGQVPLTLALDRWWEECPAAERSKRIDVVAALVRAGANPNASRQGTDGSSPLMLASRQASVEAVLLLLESKADVNSANALGSTGTVLPPERDSSIEGQTEMGERDIFVCTDLHSTRPNLRSVMVACFACLDICLTSYSMEMSPFVAWVTRWRTIHECNTDILSCACAHSSLLRSGGSFKRARSLRCSPARARRQCHPQEQIGLASLPSCQTNVRLAAAAGQIHYAHGEPSSITCQTVGGESCITPHHVYGTSW